MAVPKAIQQQVEQAEALQQQVYSEGQATPVEEVQTAPEPVVETEPATAEVIELKPAEPAKPVETPRSDEALWEHKYRTLQSKFDAEVPRLYQQLKEQNQLLQQALEAKKAEPEPEQRKPDFSKFEEDYGSDLVAMVQTVAGNAVQQAIAAEMAKMTEQFGAIKAQMGQVAERVVMSEEDKFWSSVMSLVPEWSQIDQDPRWIAFLDSTPDFAEESYREIAAKAIQKGNAQKIAKLVEKWKKELGIQPTPPQPQPQPTNPANDLSRQVAPSTTRSSTASAPQQGRIWSAAEYQEAYDPRNPQRYGVEKAAQLIAEADLAVAEGRVRW